jgi:hypothetical protein
LAPLAGLDQHDLAALVAIERWSADAAARVKLKRGGREGEEG